MESRRERRERLKARARQERRERVRESIRSPWAAVAFFVPTVTLMFYVAWVMSP